MFGKLMNNYYYGKSGKGDFRKEDMPENRWQLFWDTLKTRLSGLCRLNLMYFIIWIPTMIVLTIGYMSFLTLSNPMTIEKTDESGNTIYEEVLDENGEAIYGWENAGLSFKESVDSVVLTTLLLLIPCIAITGPATAGVSYVTRNWSRDEHAFIWSDFKDALKANWKQSIIVSLITGLLPSVAYVCWTFYGSLASTQSFMLVPQMLVLMLAVVWAISVTYMHPLLVTYDLKLKGVLKNGLLIGIARLPMSVGIRLLHMVPVIVGFLLAWFWNPVYGMLILMGYYLLIGFSLSRFVTASYTNAVFDKFINSRMEGVEINKGLRNPDDTDDDEEEEVET